MREGTLASTTAGRGISGGMRRGTYLSDSITASSTRRASAPTPGRLLSLGPETFGTHSPRASRKANTIAAAASTPT